MELLIGAYFIVAGLFATRHMKMIPEGRSLIIPLVLGLSFPIQFAILLLHYFYRIFGIDMDYGFSITITEEEEKEMTDAFMKNFSDELDEMKENIRENDEE